MLKVVVLVSGGGTNLQAILDADRQRCDHEHRDCGRDQQQ